MSKILIFGATGSVGVHTALALKEEGHEVYAVGHRRDDNGFFEDYGIHYYSVEIEHKESFEVLPKEFDVVLHFAGAMPARMKGYDPYQYINTIITGTLNVLEYMREHKCTKIVFTQSIADVLYLFGSTAPIPDDAISPTLTPF